MTSIVTSPWAASHDIADRGADHHAGDGSDHGAGGKPDHGPGRSADDAQIGALIFEFTTTQVSYLTKL